MPNQVVQEPVQSFPTDGGAAGTICGPAGVDPIFHGRRAEDSELRREIIGQTLDNDRIAAQRKVGLVLFGFADRNDQAGLGGENLADPLRGEVFEAQGTGVKSRGIGHDELAVAGTAAMLGLWLLQPSLIWA